LRRPKVWQLAVDIVGSAGIEISKVEIVVAANETSRQITPVGKASAGTALSGPAPVLYLAIYKHFSAALGQLGQSGPHLAPDRFAVQLHGDLE